MSNQVARTPRAVGVWDEYVPDRAMPWTEERVVHLHRRIGRWACRAEIDRDLKDGPKASIDRLLAGKLPAPADFEQSSRGLVESVIGAQDPVRLKAAWVYQMLLGPDPLRERLALLWHNHFATSNLKVNDLEAMQMQNDLFRTHAKARFADLCTAVVKGPAMLAWLDASSNRKGHPNENLGRELLELFTLGIGNYTERDVKEAARALTGWSVQNGEFTEVQARHDDGVKTILGRTGRWKGDGLLRLALEHPATARRLAVRLCDWLMGGGEEMQVAALAAQLQKTNLDIGRSMELVLRSREFFAGVNLRRVILSPVDWVVGVVRALELTDRLPATLQLADWITQMGQDLFYPPNVGGWPGGRAWLASRALLVRLRFASALREPACLGRGRPLDALALAKKYGAGEDRDGLLDFYTRLLVGQTPTAEWRQRVTGGLPARIPAADMARWIVALILTTPEAHVG